MKIVIKKDKIPTQYMYIFIGINALLHLSRAPVVNARLG